MSTDIRVKIKGMSSVNSVQIAVCNYVCVYLVLNMYDFI